MNNKGMIVILSAPSGCGKDTVFRELCNIRDDLCESVSATTRAPREGEMDGVNYFFKTTAEFEEMIASGSFLEYASYNNCYYGTPSAAVMDMVNNGKVCFLIIECQGAQNIMNKCPEAVSVFLMPPDLETLKNRLLKRNTDNEESIENRLKIASDEIALSSKFQYIVINNELEKAVDEINKIINIELEKRNV